MSTIVESSRQRPEVAAAIDGTAPDADASYTRNNHRSFYGYKAHVSSDREHNLIRTALISTASMQEGHLFHQVAPADTKEIYADKIYDTLRVKAWLRERGITNCILKPSVTISSGWSR